MRLALAVCAALAASPARAGFEEALSDHILPGYDGFAAATAALASAAQSDCSAEALHAPYQAAFDAWLPVGDIHIGPAESGTLGIYFWPDARGFTPETLRGFISNIDPAGTDPAAYADVSVAARGLFALDMLLYDDGFAYAPGDYTCTLVQTIAVDLASQAAALDAGWQDQAALMRSAGEAGNVTYLDPKEVDQAIYTQVLAGLTMTLDNRLGRPMGTFERPRPTRAEAWRSGRPLPNILGSADMAAALATDLADGNAPQTAAALAEVHAAAERVTDPTFQNIEDPQARFLVEILQQKIKALKDTIEVELGLASGFNSTDGD